MFFKKFINGFRAMDSGVIPENEDGFLKMAREGFKETNDLLSVDIGVGGQGEVKSDTGSYGSDAQSCKHRNLFVGPGFLIEKRCRARRSPCSPNKRSHQKSALVDKDKVGLHLPYFFLIEGHSVRIHW